MPAINNTGLIHNDQKRQKTKLNRIRFLILILWVLVLLFVSAPCVYAAIYLRIVPPESGWHDLGNRILYVDLTLTNTGDQIAKNVVVTKITPRTPVTYNNTLSPAYPIVFGDIAVGAKSTRRIYLNVPAGTVEVIYTASGQCKSASGTNYSWSSGVKIRVPTTDTVPPAISIVYPQDGAMINQTKPQIVATYADSDSGIDSTSFYAEINGVNSTSLFTVTDTQATYQVTTNLPAGNNVITTIIGDKRGNKAGITSNFRIDIVPPSLSISPQDGAMLNQTKPQIVATYADSDSGIDTTSFYAEINGVNSTSLFTVTDNQATYQPATDLIIGNNAIISSIKDKAGNIINAASNFRIGILRAIPSANPTSGYAPLAVNFKTNGEDPAGTLEVFRWDFDGNGTWDTYDTVANDYTHTYNTAGTYNALLYVKSSTGAEATGSIPISVQNNPPTASADIFPSNGAVPLSAQLNGSGTDSDGSIAFYEWDFNGDGVYDWSSISTGNTTYTYNTEGTYQAVFRVTDNSGLTATATAVTTVIRAGPPGSPTATAQATPTSGEAPLVVNFNGSATDPNNNIVLYEWDYDGDGVYDWSSATMTQTTFTYTQAGSHIASFRVTDATGLTGIDQIIIKVNIKTSLSILNNTVGFLSSNFINYCRQAGVTVNVSSVYYNYYPGNNVKDGNSETFWLSAYGDTPSQGASPFIEVTFPSLQTVSQINLNGGSWWGYYGITRCRIELFNASNALLYSSENGISTPYIEIPIPETMNVTRCRLTVLATQNVYPYTSLGEFEIGRLPTGTLEPTGTNINTSLSASTGVSVYIKDAEGNKVRTLVNNRLRDMGSYSDYWDCKDDNGFVVNDGLYYAILSYQFEGNWQELDLTNNTGGSRYSYPFGSGCDTRDSFNVDFSPFENDLLPLTFRLCKAQEVTAFIGPLWGGADATRVRTIVNRKVFPAGTSTIYWDGLDDKGNIAQASQWDNLITGFWRYDLPDNAIYMTGGTPKISAISADNNYFSPFSEKCAPDGKGEGININYTVSKGVQYVELRVYNVETSALLRTIRINNVEAGEHTVFWDGKNNNNEFVDIGDYRIGIIARDSQGNESMLRYILVRLDY